MPIRPWEDVENDIMPNLSIPREEARRIYEAQQQLDEQRQVESQRTSEGVGEYLRRRAVPFVSSIGNFLDASNHADATDRINRGTHSPSDILAVAHHERAEEIDRGRGWGGQLLSGLTHIPAVLGEFAVGGAAFRGLTGASRLGSVAAWGGRTLGTTALAPSMYADQAAQTNIAANRHPTDPRGFGTAYLAGALQTAILGSVGSQVNKAFGSGIASTLGRMGISGPVGVIESTAANALAHWTGLQNGYGATMDSLLKGEYGEAGAHFASEALTFAVFAGLHEAQHRAKIGMKPGLPEATEQVLNAAADHMQTAAEQGKPPEQAASELPGSVRTAMDAAGIHPDVGRPILVNPQGEATTPGQRDAAAQRIAELRARGLSDDQIAKAFLYGDKPKVPQEATPQAPQGPSAPAEQPQARTPTQPPQGTPEATPGPPQAPAASPKAPQTQRRQTPPEVRQAALEMIDSLGGKDAKTKAANRADVESIASSREFADPGELVQEVYRERGKGNAQGQDTGWLKAPAEPSPVEATPAEKPSPASWESLHERAAAGDVAARKEVSDRAGLTKTEAADYWRRLENPGMTYAELAGKVGRKEGSMRTYVSSARKKINESSGGMFDKAKAAATAAAEAEKQRRLAQGATVEGLQGSGPARPTADEMTGDRLANWWETKTGVNLAEQNSEGAHRKADDFISELAAVKGNRKGEAAAEALKRAYPELQELEPDELKSLIYSIEDHQRAYQRNAGGTGPSAPEGPRGEDANRGAGEAAGGAPAQEARPEAVPPRFGGRETAVPVEPAAAPAVMRPPEGMGAATMGAAPAPPPPQTRGVGSPFVPETARTPDPVSLKSVVDFFRSFANKTFPSLTRVAPSSGEKLAAAANSDATVKATWDYMSGILKVGGKRLADLTLDERRLLGATWLEMRFRHYRDVLTNAGEDASYVPTLIGQADSPLASEAMFNQAHGELWSFFEAVKQEWTPVVEANFKKTMGMSPADVIDARSQIPGLPLNAIALDQSGSPGVVGVGGKQSLGNVRVKRPGFTRSAEMSGDAYDVDIAHMMQRTLDLGIPASRRADFVRDAIAKGVIEKVTPGGAPSEGYKYLALDPAHGMRGLDANASYYAKPEAFREIVQGLGIGERPGQVVASALRPIMDKVYNVALMSPVELMTHIGNHVTALFRPGMGVPILNALKSAQNIIGVWGRDPVMMEKVMKLSDIGASFSHESHAGILGERFAKYDPTAYLNKFTSSLIDAMQKGVRVQLGDAYDKLAGSGHFQASDTAKRDFINQALGNYGNRANNALTQFLKDSGLQGFATAAHTFTIQGIKSSVGSAINSPATTFAKAAELRAVSIAKLLPILALGPVLNSLLHGEAFPADVPAFAIKTGDDEKGNARYFDQLAFTGVRRGWRATGMHSIIQALAHPEEARTTGQIVDRALSDARLSLSHLFEGPPAQFLHTAMTGQNTFGHPVAEKAGEGSQGLLNVKAAALAANPLVASFSNAENRREPRTWAENLMQSAGPFGLHTGQSGVLQSFHDRLARLQVARQEHMMGPGRLGQAFPQAQEHAMLQAYGRPIGRLQEVLNGRSRRMGYRGPEQDPAHEAYLRSQINRLAKEALERTRGVRR